MIGRIQIFKIAHTRCRHKSVEHKFLVQLVIFLIENSTETIFFHRILYDRKPENYVYTICILSIHKWQDSHYLNDYKLTEGIYKNKCSCLQMVEIICFILSLGGMITASFLMYLLFISKDKILLAERNSRFSSLTVLVNK